MSEEKDKGTNLEGLADLFPMPNDEIDLNGKVTIRMLTEEEANALRPDEDEEEDE